jgi:hypothetical protein
MSFLSVQILYSEGYLKCIARFRDTPTGKTRGSQACAFKDRAIHRHIEEPLYFVTL